MNSLKMHISTIVTRSNLAENIICETFITPLKRARVGIKAKGHMALLQTR